MIFAVYFWVFYFNYLSTPYINGLYFAVIYNIGNLFPILSNYNFNHSRLEHCKINVKKVEHLNISHAFSYISDIHSQKRVVLILLKTLCKILLNRMPQKKVSNSHIYTCKYLIVFIKVCIIICQNSSTHKQIHSHTHTHKQTRLGLKGLSTETLLQNNKQML